jgi:SOS-response transcriptional repressor LexA
LREYVPGNLIYANGNRFVARRFHRDIDEQRAEMPVFEVSTDRQAVKETTLGTTPSALGATMLQTISVCDVDLIHQSHISDEEELRFQLGVTVHGLERNQHNGGKAYRWGEKSLHHRRGVRLRLVNVGASAAIGRFDRFGYPICTVCGQSVSPLSSDLQRAHFDESHQERCNRPPIPVGFYADIVADVMSLPGCPDQSTAYSVLEALRFAATRVLDMHMDDLQVLVIGHVDRDEVDALLWDPMPGGSGLIDQICERFDEVVAVAKEVVDNCPSLCETSCVDCLQTFRNSYYHKHLFRQLALECLDEWGPRLRFSHEIPAKQPSKDPGEGTHPVNEVERKLRFLLLAAGFEEGVRGEQVKLDRAIGTTTPDVIYRGTHHDDDEGVCIYLDGLSNHIHGNQKTAEKDQRIRTWLRNNGYEVIEIAVSDLDDQGAMTRHFRRLAGYLRADDIRNSIKDDTSWFSRAEKKTSPETRSVYRLVHPKPEDYFSTCIPLVPLKLAAGSLNDPESSNKDDLDWVEIDTLRQLRQGMFVAQVKGKSMEPLIPDGSYCLFTSSVTGTRQNRTVVVQLLDSVDPETGERYTVKRYSSEKAATEDGSWRHLKVTLKPNNPDFEPIVLTCEDEGSVQVVAELLEVLG